jgi:uncharacterized membrane protein
MQGLIDLAQRGTDIKVNLELPGIVALVAGILILVMPRILNYIVAAYLIIVGLIMLFDIRI